MRGPISRNTNDACCGAAPSRASRSTNSMIPKSCRLFGQDHAPERVRSRMPNERLPAFAKFIADLRAVWADEGEDARRMERAKPLLETFVMDQDLKAHATQWPSTEGLKNLLLYVDPDYGFVVNGVVRAPGRTGSVHDHAGAFVL